MTSIRDSRQTTERAEYISGQLPRNVALLLRLLRNEIPGGYSWTETGLLAGLAESPRRITELAALEGLAQPTTTLLVKRLEERGLVRRERQADDQRVVLVWLTDAGEATLEHVRALAAAALRGHLDTLTNHELGALATATDVLAQLNVKLLND